MTIYLFNYNNYYNRQVKGFDYVEEYPEYTEAFFEMQFNPNDGIETTIVINSTLVDTCDYCIVCNDNNSINSRWFIMEAKRTRQGQYQVSLKRDVLIDYKNNILEAPCFIEKATLDINNPLILNKENFDVNRIKSSEHLLKDLSGLPWVVAYINKTVEKTINLPRSDVDVSITVNTLDQYEYYADRDAIRTNARGSKYEMLFYNSKTATGPFVCSWDDTGNPTTATSVIGIDDRYSDKLPFGCEKQYGSQSAGFKVQDKESASTVATSIFDIVKQKNWNYDIPEYVVSNDTKYYSDYQAILDEQNKIIFETETGTYYRVVLSEPKTITRTVIAQADSGIGLAFKDVANDCKYLNGNSYSDKVGYVTAKLDIYKISFDPIPQEALTLTISSDRIHTINAPYDIIAFPVGHYIIDRRNGESYEEVGNETSADIALELAAALSAQLSSSELYDIQLLPYSPVNPLYVRDYKWLDIDDANTTRMALLTETNGTLPWTVLFYIENQSFTAQLFTDGDDPIRPLKQFEIGKASNAIDLKIQNECRDYRIVSPNYASIFSINAAKNGGLKNLRADCTYKPFTPYIRVYPEFDLLYGDNFGDSRGMIISGDFSLPRTQNDWINYQQQNKNYQNIFNRQIENLEFNNRLNMLEAHINAGVGAATTGVQTGLMVGSAYGAGAGIGAGAGLAVASTLAGAADIAILKQRQSETLDYTKDLFGYQLGNIKARPDTVAKVSAFDINSKVWPFIEVYKCTEVEEQALRDKLKWNGMTVGVIGTIEKYLRNEETYIKGKLIRLSDLNVDFHMAVEIADEINKGVFI